LGARFLPLPEARLALAFLDPDLLAIRRQHRADCGDRFVSYNERANPLVDRAGLDPGLQLDRCDRLGLLLVEQNPNNDVSCSRGPGLGVDADRWVPIVDCDLWRRGHRRCRRQRRPDRRRDHPHPARLSLHGRNADLPARGRLV
jgi:hypothetical protein